MPLQLIRADITKMEVDAVVNAANSTLLGGGGVDGAIHSAAGPELLRECRALGGCETGQAKITLGYKMPCKYIIHTVGPVWHGGKENEENLLYSCYSNSLSLAAEKGCESVAFPLISSGIYGYPKAQALGVATRAIRDFLEKNDDDVLVYIVIFDKTAFEVSSSFFGKIEQRINDFEVEQAELRDISYGRREHGNLLNKSGIFQAKAKKEKNSLSSEKGGFCASSPIIFADAAALSEPEFALDESFSEMLLRKIDEKGMTDAQCYKKANIDRKLFSKIRNNPNHKPSKATAIAFAIALELPLEEATDLLLKAGYALSPSSKFDVIVEYFIRYQRYDIFEINEALFEFDQPLLGV